MRRRKLLMVPGPVEFTGEVLAALSKPTDNHVSGDFIECFGRSLEMLQEVFIAPGYTTFIMAGSGTLAMDMAVANLVEPKDRVLVVSSGYFSRRMAEIVRCYGGVVDFLEAPVGDAPNAK